MLKLSSIILYDVKNLTSLKKHSSLYNIIHNVYFPLLDIFKKESFEVLTVNIALNMLNVFTANQCNGNIGVGSRKLKSQFRQRRALQHNYWALAAKEQIFIKAARLECFYYEIYVIRDNFHVCS